jgi:hypothetical protein
MGTLSGGNGGGSPSDGGGDPFDGLPELPPEWGIVVVPDDPAELAEESAEVRRELRREARHGRWRRWLGLSGPVSPEGLPSPRLPILIMAIAVLAALISMVAMGWQREALRPPTSTTGQPTAASTDAVTELRSLPALELIDSAGGTVSLRSLTPSVILLTDSCDCADLIRATAAAAPNEVRIVTVARTSSPPAPAAFGVQSLGDPTGELRKAVGLAGDGQAVALLVNRDGQVVRAIPGVSAVDAYRADLPGLAA